MGYSHLRNMGHYKCLIDVDPKPGTGRSQWREIRTCGPLFIHRGHDTKPDRGLGETPALEVGVWVPEVGPESVRHL